MAKDGLEAYYLARQGKYKQAVKILLSLGNERNDCDDFNLGYYYEHGLGVEQDYSEAARYYLMSANSSAKNESATVRLGYLYEHGLGVKQDDDKAIYWYKRMLDNYIPGYYDDQAEFAKKGLKRLGAW